MGEAASWCYQTDSRAWVGAGGLTAWWSYHSLAWWLRDQGLEVSPEDLLTAGLAEYAIPGQSCIVMGTTLPEAVFALDAEVRLERMGEEYEMCDLPGWDMHNEWDYDEEDYWNQPSQHLDLEDWYGLDRKKCWHR
jgi:hypothetical protein